jgi:ApbE superfamily uncharacterized protein (UPF0280 family)
MEAEDLIYFRVKQEQSDLYIGAKKNLSGNAKQALDEARGYIKNEISKRPAFLSSFYPLMYTGGSADIIRRMYSASSACDVGPMAAVAGAVAQYVGESLGDKSDEVIVENGGDIFIRSTKERRVAVYAGQSTLSGKMAVLLKEGTWGICTSSYSVGHSYSDGRCDAALVICRDCALADAAATALGNSIKKERHLERGVQDIMNIDGVLGALAVINEKIAAAGDITLGPV